MIRDRKQYTDYGGLWALAFGATAGMAAGVAWVAWRRGLRRPAVLAAEARLSAMEDAVVDALRSDADLGNRGIEVAALTDGIIELSGAVDNEAEEDRAVAIAQRVPGVRTVLNRLDVSTVDARLEEARRRYAAGDPSLHGAGWSGVGVGTGQRRQGLQTDPDRPAEDVDLETRALGVDRALEQSSEDLDKLAPGGAGGTSGPAAPTDRGTLEHADHGRPGNPPPPGIQDLNPDAGVLREVKKGTELTLEQSGLQPEEPAG